MISSFVTVLIIVIFLLPGFVILAISGTSRRLPDFQLVLKSMLWSLFLHVIYTLPIVVYYYQPLLKANEGIQKLIVQHKTFFEAPEQFLRILTPFYAFTVLVVLGPILLSYLVGWAYGKLRLGLALQDRSERTVLQDVFRAYWRNNLRPLVRLSIKDGPTYFGQVAVGASEWSKEILLHKPYMYQSEDDIEPEVVEGYVYVKLDDMVHVQFWEDPGGVLTKYVGGTTEAASQTGRATAVPPAAGQVAAAGDSSNKAASNSGDRP